MSVSYCPTSILDCFIRILNAEPTFSSQNLRRTETATFLNTTKTTNNSVNGPRIRDTNTEDITTKDWDKVELAGIGLINWKVSGFNGDSSLKRFLGMKGLRC